MASGPQADPPAAPGPPADDFAAAAEGPEAFSLQTLRKRGRLKVFLGYAAGVGKTYTMLSEAHRRAARGEDVVIGFVEPHDRKETSDLVDGLEQVPPKLIEYRGTVFEELDTDAVIARKPALVLVDELAHTNVPGTAHEKRWQSVEELLDAGINVLTTVNVQHLESLNDTVFQITGVRVQETVPDSRARPRRRGRARRPDDRRAAQPAQPRRRLRPRQDPRRAPELLHARQPAGAARAGAAQDGGRGGRLPREVPASRSTRPSTPGPPKTASSSASARASRPRS